MTVHRLPTPWVATAVLLVGLGTDPGAEDRVSVSDDPVTRLESALPGSPQDEPGSDTSNAPGLPPGDAGSTRLGALALVGTLAARRGRMNRIESLPTRGPPGDPGPPVGFFPLVPSRIDTIPLDLPHSRSTGRGPLTLGPEARSASNAVHAS